MINKADAMGIPHEVLGAMMLGEAQYEQQKDLLEHQAFIDVRKAQMLLEHASVVEVQKEEKMLNVWLNAARQTQLAPYHALKDIEQYLEQAYQRRHRLTELPAPTPADIDLLNLLDRAIPVLEDDFHARVRKIAISSGHGEEH
jgi:hypothetical protein